jgi:hypothetical protein
MHNVFMVKEIKFSGHWMVACNKHRCGGLETPEGTNWISGNGVMNVFQHKIFRVTISYPCVG